ncbi:MAG: Yip1 family protein [Gammaproteobacteria bacterium]|nr:Yip1 family protein [Gammaproteobacteria bacterium]
MDKGFSPLLLLRLVFTPTAVFKVLANTRPAPMAVFLKIAIWFGMLPPVFAYLGATEHGWNLGTIEPLYFSNDTLLGISISYFIALLIGFVSTAIVSRWMASTYGARRSFGIHLAMISIVGAPIAVGSVIHLYPDVFINILVLVPTILWSMYLLYRGLPIVLRTSPERGMLMASSLIGYFLVAFVSLLGITVVLWGYGFGPTLGI